MAILPPRVNLDAQRLNASPNTPSSHQLLLAAQQQGAMAESRAMTELPQRVNEVRHELQGRQQQASDMAYRAKAAVQSLVDPESLPGRAGVLAMAAQAPEGMNPDLAILARLGMA